MAVPVFTGGPNVAAPTPADRVCAIVVTYHPGPEVPAHIDAIRRQVERVIVVDNESTPQSRDLLSACSSSSGVELIENTENLGIAAAFNQGLDRATAAGFDWVATFDQDSQVPDNYVRQLLDAHSRDPRKERAAVVAPVYRDRHLGFVYSPADGPLTGPSAEIFPVKVTASSGNLVSMAAVRSAGGFREDFFMACVDFEFCLRCRSAGWLVLEVRSVVLDHALGKYEERPWLWLRPRLNDYDAGRRYYQARNLSLLYARYIGFDPAWVVRDAARYFRDLVKLVLFGRNRGEKLRAVGRGVVHAMTGKLGRLPGMNEAGFVPPPEAASRR